MEKPYNKSVDLWTIGIITYLLLCGCLPFDDEHSEREIARQTINDPTPFPGMFWKKLSSEARMFVDSKYRFLYLIIDLLSKNPSKRMSIKEVLEHPWIMKFTSKEIIDQRKKSGDLNNDLKFFVSNADEA